MLLAAGCGTASGSDPLPEIKKAIVEKGARWQAGESWVSRLSEEEFRSFCGAVRQPKDLSKAFLIDLPKMKDLPQIVDWRNNSGNWVTPVRNQGSCGSCWDFSAVAQVESWWKIFNANTDSMIDLSEQFILSCSETGSCNGGSIEAALEYVRVTGVPGEACFKYKAVDTLLCSDACPDWQSQAVKIPGWGYVTLAEAIVENIKNAVIRHPLSTTYTVYQDFPFYTGGVYEHVFGEDLGAHAILIVGWNDLEQSWIVKNSWGPFWGESGYFRIKWGDSGIGQFAPFIWDEVTGENALVLSTDRIDVTLAPGESADELITLTYTGSQVLEFAAIDYEVPIIFHPDAFNSWDGMSWWCGDPEIGGYQNHWLQYLDTPPLNLLGTSSPVLEWMGYWSIEDQGGTDPPWDGWDGCNVWTSADGGDNFTVASPVKPAYTANSLWSFGEAEQGWNMGPGIPGWGGKSGGWVQAEFDLSVYKSAETVIRFAFASDMGFCTEDDSSVTGFFVDEITVSDGSSVLFQNDGETGGGMSRKGSGSRKAEWISIENGSGILQPGESHLIDIHIETSSLDEANFEGYIMISTNDTLSPYVQIPIFLNLETAVEEDRGVNPESFGLLQNYPNPFNTTTVIPYEVAARSEVELSVYDLAGRSVRILVSGAIDAGEYQVTWDGKDSDGSTSVSGLYLVRLRAGDQMMTRKMLLVR